MKALFNILIIIGIGAQEVQAEDFDTTVLMQDKGAATYYVAAEIEGYGPVDLMVDTGSGYLTINEHALETLQARQQVQYVKKLRGTLANGDQLIVPVYSLNAINIGGGCWLHDVEAAVFPGKTRFILGLSALSRAAPFIFSTSPPRLVLSNCDDSPREASDT